MATYSEVDLFEWSCSNCDFSDSTLRDPFGAIDPNRHIDPKPGVIKSQIEYRWCSDCVGIRTVFTAKGYIYKLGEEPNSSIDPILLPMRAYYPSIKSLKAKIEKLKSKKMRLEKIKKETFFFFISNEADELEAVSYVLSSFQSDLQLYIKSEIECEKLTKLGQNHYQKMELKPKCLSCGSQNVSEYDWSKESHICGGKFLRKKGKKKVFEEVRFYQHITYDEQGNPESEMLSLPGRRM